MARSSDRLRNRRLAPTNPLTRTLSTRDVSGWRRCRQQGLGAIVVLALALGGLFVSASPVGAQEACDLIDDVGVTDANGLRAAIQAAEDDTGIDFAVYATPQLLSDTGNLDAVLSGEVSAACPQIFGSPNNVANNTVLLAVSVGNQWTVFSYGDDLDSRLDDDANDIVGRMNVFFANGEIGAGLASGIGSTVEGLQTEPSSAGGALAGGALGAAAVVGGGAWLYTKRRSASARGEVAGESFRAGSSKVTGIQARWYDAEQEAVVVGGRITGNAMARMNTAQTEAAEASRALYEAWSPVSEVTVDDVSRMSIEDQREVNGHVTDALNHVDLASEKVRALEELMDELRNKPDNLAAMHRTAQEQIASGLNAADAREAEGWVVTAGRERLTELAQSLDVLDPFALRVDVDLLGTELEPIATEIVSVSGDLETLADRHRETGERRSGMAAEIQGQRGRVMQLRAQVHDWEREHATSSFENVLGHPDESDRQLDRADQSHMASNSIGEIPRDIAAMRMVDNELEKAQTAVDLADELLDEMDELDVLLSAAKQGASAAVAAAADDARVLINYISENRNAVPSRAPEVAGQVAAIQEAAESQLRLSPPDYLRAMELAGQVESIVETELGEFEAKVAEQQRLQHKAESELRSATVAVDRADRHVQSHMFSGRRDQEAQASIDRLRSDLHAVSVMIGTDPGKADKEAKRIEQSADQIYREYQRRQRHNGRGGFGGGFGGGIIVGGGGFRGHGGGRGHRGGGWGCLLYTSPSPRDRQKSRMPSSA